MKQLSFGHVGRIRVSHSGCAASAAQEHWVATHRQTASRTPCRLLRAAAAAAVEPTSVPSVSNGSVEVGGEATAACSTSTSSSSSSSWSYRMAFERLYQSNPAVGSAQDSISEQLWSRGLFLVSVDDKPKTTPPTKGPGEKSPDYYANVGDAIRTLREDIPRLFEQDLNYDIYQDDITFRDPRNSFTGIKNYQLIFWSLRFHGRIFFKQLYVEVKRIWQPSDGVISMRWTVHGVPRVPWEAEGTFDGISQYKLDSEGRIYEHAVDNVILRDPPVQGLPLLAGLNLVQAAPQQPCPGAWFRGLEEGAAAAAASAAHVAANTLDRSNSWLAALVHFSWVHLYAASLGTLQLHAAGGQLVPAAAAAGLSASSSVHSRATDSAAC